MPKTKSTSRKIPTKTPRPALMRSAKLSPKVDSAVADLVGDLLEDEPEFVAELQARLIARQTVKWLSVMCCRAGLSQKELAEKMGCSQPKISKIKSGVDKDLKLSDIIAYLELTSHKARLEFALAGESDDAPTLSVCLSLTRGEPDPPNPPQS